MKRILIVVIALVVAAGLYLLFRPDDTDEPSANPPPTTVATTGEATTTVTTTAPLPPPGPPPPAQVRILVRGGLPVGGPRRVTVARNRRVILTVSSDVSDHVHLHGYDLMQDVGPGMPARIAFRATRPGTIEAELEDSGVQIARITAQ